jgi:serine/tyrosine/threonine adenylyltransferase
MAAGFVHGVLNTDNINITGESFDYGPWRWLPTYTPGFTAAYFDHSGLYAYGRQPEALLWNLAQLGSCLLALVPKEALLSVLDGYEPRMHADYAAATLRRLGLAPQGADEDAALARAFAQFMEASQVPFEQAWFDWHGGLAREAQAMRGPAAAYYALESFVAFRAALAGYAPADGARLDHPYFSRTSPCAMLIDEVEAIWARIAEADDWSRFEAKLAEIGAMAEAYGNTPPMP